MEDHYVLQGDWIAQVTTDHRNLVMMKVCITTMEPTIKDGDVAMLDTGRTRIHNGCTFALGINETIVIKELEHLASGNVRIISTNRDEYAPYEVSIDDIRIIGQVIGFARQLARDE